LKIQDGGGRHFKNGHCKYTLYLHNDTLHNFDNKTANINAKNCSLSIVLVATNLKPQKSLKGHITQHHVNIQAM